MLRASFFVLTSTRDTVPSPWLRVQMAPPPAVRKRGRDPVSTLSVTRFVFGSTRATRLFSVLDTQIAPSSPTTQANEPEGTCISATTLFVSGSIRDRIPFRSLSIHTLSALVAIPPSLSAGPAEIVAATSFVFISTRESVWSPQFGTHMLPKPAASPEHGFFPTSTVAITLFVLGSSRCTVFFGLLVTQTAS